MIGPALDQFEAWRSDARTRLQHGVKPGAAGWSIESEAQEEMFAQFDRSPANAKVNLNVPKDFMPLAESVACHSDPERWNLLYTALWRMTHGEKHLLALASDPLVRRLKLLEKAVRRDAHKAKAFIRFRKLESEDGERFIAWHRSDHDVLPLIAGFFQRRFAVMRWTVFTQLRSLDWDGAKLTFGDGIPESQAPKIDDELEDIWRTYYRATFNPARIKLNMMRREMPVRYWATMPETDIIQGMLDEAPTRVAAMIEHQEGLATSAADFIPEDRSLPSLMAAAKNCQGCPLYQKANCTVFGEGKADASLMIVGETPGYEEDKAGRPFIGPAGQMLNKALAEASVTRDDLYLTNAVKHFKYVMNENVFAHVTPSRHEASACKPWLLAEIDAVKPKAILTLGVTAGRSLFGPGFTLKSMQGRWHEGPGDLKIRSSWHPAAILRANDRAQGDLMFAALVGDLRAAYEFAGQAAFSLP